MHKFVGEVHLKGLPVVLQVYAGSKTRLETKVEIIGKKIRFLGGKLLICMARLEGFEPPPSDPKKGATAFIDCSEITAA
jgi:hypothetical protein